MTKSINIAAIALNQTPLDWEGNALRIKTSISTARDAGANIICLPELTISGYGCEDMFLAPWVSEKAWQMLHNIKTSCKDLIVAIGLPFMHRGITYNVVALVVDGEIVGLVAKRYLARSGLHYEPRWFSPYPREKFELVTDQIPFGDIYFNISNIILGIEICEDAWVADRPGRNLAEQGVDVILNPCASHFAPGKVDIRRTINIEGSRAFNCIIASANLLGCESGRAVFDGDACIVSGGDLKAESMRFSFRDYTFSMTSVDILDNRRLRSENRPLLNRDVSKHGEILVDFNTPATSVSKTISHTSAAPNESLEIVRATSLGIFDYLRKSKQRGMVISLSGGADSSAVTVFAFLALKLAIHELTLPKAAERLPNIAALLSEDNLTESAFIKSAITCVYQATRNSSEDTRQAALALANSLGITCLLWDIDGLIDQYTSIIEKSIGRKLDWRTDDLTLQNIQPRVRVPGVWMLANVKGALLLSTGNRSESAVGYMTMDGDTSGGFNPIGSLSKAHLLRLLEWLSNNSIDGMEPISGLKATLKLQPSAELRPLIEQQTDEKDLMPYNVLEIIERLALQKKYSAVDVKAQLFEECNGSYSVTECHNFVDRFFTLWQQSQWKREKLPLSLHISDFNLDPRSGFRFPVLSAKI